MGEVYRARDTQARIATSRSRCCRRRVRDRSRTARRASSAKRRCSRRSIIRTSPRSTASRRPGRPGGRRCLVHGAGREAQTAGAIGSHRGPTSRSTKPLPIAHQIADALEAAHEQGRHPPRPQTRQHQGHAPTASVKVLDFGLARDARGGRDRTGRRGGSGRRGWKARRGETRTWRRGSDLRR